MSATVRSEIEREMITLGPVSRPMQVFSRGLLVLFVALALSLSLVPWQQNTDARGRVTAYAPTERQQVIEAPIEGRLVRWYVTEGSRVTKGEPLLDIADNDPEIVSRLSAERDAVLSRIKAAEARVTAISDRIVALRSSRTSAVSAADARIRMAEQRKTATDQALAAAEANSKAATLNYERQRSLFDQGLTSKRAVELAEADEVRGRTEVDRARATQSAARSEVDAVLSDLGKVGNDAFASVSDAEAARASAESEIASGKAELSRIDVRLARQQTQHVRAPADGTVLHALARVGGEVVKAGDPLLTFVPAIHDRAVELWVAGNDINLVHPGESVRLQFEGWPAFQFAGWPSTALGTFPGKVAYVDSATQDPKGRFRVVIVPLEPDTWPAEDRLRQGTRVNGWILLGRVKLGYELWRQFNGFPPEWVQDDGGDAKSGKDKDPKAGGSKP